MLSLELAKKLKEAGLKWEQHELDFYHWPYRGDLYQLMCFEIALFYCDDDEAYKTTKEHGIFAPRLDQLLTEINKKGRKYELYSHPEFGKYHCITQRGGERRLFDADSPEEAAAKALVWILEQEREGRA